MKRLMVALAACLLTSCSSMSPQSYHQSTSTQQSNAWREIKRPEEPADVIYGYKVMAPPTKNRVCVTTEWATPAVILAQCGKGTGACFIQSSTDPDEIMVIMEEPKDFTDEYRLMILGHEVFHGLGATHD